MLCKYIANAQFRFEDFVISPGDTLEIIDDLITNKSTGKFTHRMARCIMDTILEGCDKTPEDEEELEDYKEDCENIYAKGRKIIPTEVYDKLVEIGIIDNNTRSHNVGDSDYSKHLIQPWTIWKEYNLDPWDADIIKRVLRTKHILGKSAEESRIEDYQKIIHICEEKIRQLTTTK